MKKTAWPAAAAAVVAIGITLTACRGAATAGASDAGTASAEAVGGSPAPSAARTWYSVCSDVINQTGTSNTWQSTDENSNKATIAACGYWVTQVGATAGNVIVWTVFAEKDDQSASFDSSSVFNDFYMGSASNCNQPNSYGCPHLGIVMGQVAQSGALATGAAGPLYAGPFQMYATITQMPYNDAIPPLGLVYHIDCADGDCGPGVTIDKTLNVTLGAGKQAIPIG